MIEILRQCQRELKDLPKDVREDLADALARLQEGHTLSLPLSRPMPSIGKGVHELRFRDRSGVYRVIYYLAGGGSIWLLYAFQKKTEKTSPHDIEVAQKRLREVL